MRLPSGVELTQLSDFAVLDARRTELFAGLAWGSDWITAHCGPGLRISVGVAGVLVEDEAERVRTALEALRALRRELEASR